jgi:MscS family membrane protein
MRASDRYQKRGIPLIVVFALLIFPGISWAQAGTPTAQAPPPPPRDTPQDTLGRTTPRGAVLGFLSAIRKGNTQVAALYLNTPLRGEEAGLLAHQLATVLDRRLPAQINQISDKPEGSIPDPLRPDEDLVGTIETAHGELDITVERVDRGKVGTVWLFSSKTLSSIPGVFQELITPPLEQILPEFLVKTHIADIPLYEWLALFVGMPLLFVATGLLSRALSSLIGALRRRVTHDPTLGNPRILRMPGRLVLIALIIKLVVESVALPLLARQFWSTGALLIVIVACVWWLLSLTGSIEGYLVRRRQTASGSASVLRLLRRLMDGLMLFGGFLFVLYHFGINLTAAFAGLGVGGIAVALAAQKTLENVIAGVSLIADEAVRIGDFLNLGDVQGTVESVGLRSTRIRTLDRTIVSLPNGQIANMRLETLSARDKFWFHPVIALRYETTPPQLQTILTGIRELLGQQPTVDTQSVRVRLIRFGTFSLDIDVSAYASAHDWNDLLEYQEKLLFRIADIVHEAGTDFAFPSQTLYLASDKSNHLPKPFSILSTKNEAHAGMPARSGRFGAL